MKTFATQRTHERCLNFRVAQPPNQLRRARARAHLHCAASRTRLHAASKSGPPPQCSTSGSQAGGQPSPRCGLWRSLPLPHWESVQPLPAAGGKPPLHCRLVCLSWVVDIARVRLPAWFSPCGLAERACRFWWRRQGLEPRAAYQFVLKTNVLFGKIKSHTT